MNILYITRKFPPGTGGMQTQSKQFYENLSSIDEVTLVAWGHTQILLPLFFIFAFLKSAIVLIVRKIDIIQLGDLVLSPLGFLLKRIFNKPVFTVSHGKDSVYGNKFYNFFIIGSAGKLDKIICVSNNNLKTLSKRGIPEEKMCVIPNGININEGSGRKDDKEDYCNLLEKRFGLDLKNKKIILSLSRLVPKKGIEEFVKHIFPDINKKAGPVYFLIGGEGPERDKIRKAIDNFNLKENVHLLGNIEHGSVLYYALFSISDVFVMPNMRVSDDAEGFGIVALEAAINSVPVVAYNVDGLSEAVHNDKNGILVKEGQREAFSSAVSLFLKDNIFKQDFSSKAKKYVVDNFSWERIIYMYHKEYFNFLGR